MTEKEEKTFCSPNRDGVAAVLTFLFLGGGRNFFDAEIVSVAKVQGWAPAVIFGFNPFHPTGPFLAPKLII